MDIGYLIGFLGIALGVCVPIPQIIKIIKTGKTGDISLKTYTFLVLALVCYLSHAIYIESIVFTIAQSINLTTNTTVLYLLIKGRRNK